MTVGEATAGDAADTSTLAHTAQVQLEIADVATSPAESIGIQPRAVLDDIYNAVRASPGGVCGAAVFRKRSCARACTIALLHTTGE